MIVHCFTTIIILIVTMTITSSKVRVIGGKDASVIPHQVSVRVRGYHKCGGSVIGNQWILTAAHCLIKYFDRASEVTVVVGSNHLINGGVAYHATQIFIHHGYNESNHAHDIGLLKTNKVIEFTEAVRPIPLANFNVLEDDEECVAAIFTGWGSKYLNGTNYDVLQEIQLCVIKLSTCQKTFAEVTPGSLCTLSQPGNGICYGDSGGALVTDGQQIGIAAWGSPCAQGYPDIHTHVYYYLEWIKSTIEFNDDK